MGKILTDGKIKIGVYNFPDRKLPSLCISSGNKIIVCGRFNNEEMADFFMEELAKFVGVKEGDIDD